MESDNTMIVEVLKNHSPVATGVTRFPQRTVGEPSFFFFFLIGYRFLFVLSSNTPN